MIDIKVGISVIIILGAAVFALYLESNKKSFTETCYNRVINGAAGPQDYKCVMNGKSLK